MKQLRSTEADRMYLAYILSGDTSVLPKAPKKRTIKRPQVAYLAGWRGKPVYHVPKQVHRKTGKNGVFRTKPFEPALVHKSHCAKIAEYGINENGIVPYNKLHTSKRSDPNNYKHGSSSLVMCPPHKLRGPQDDG